MKKFLALGTFCALMIAAPLAAHANTLTASQSISFIGLTTTGSQTTVDPVSGITSFDLASTTVLAGNNGQGDFAGVVHSGHAFTSTDLYPYGADGGTGGDPFSITFSDNAGTFVADSNPIIVSNTSSGTTASAVTIYLRGVFTPGSAFPTATANNASIIFTFNESSGSVSGSATFATPAVNLNPVPEPSSLILLGTGLLGGVGVIRRRLSA